MQYIAALVDKYAEHASEERGYVTQCIDRLIDLGCEVKNGAKKETPVCTDALDWIKYDLQISKDGLAWLADIVEAARDDLTTYDVLKILKEYYKDEESDMYWAEQQLELVKIIGRENWFASMI